MKLLKKIFDDSKFENTKFQSELFNKEYGEKIVLKNSIKTNIQLFLISIGVCCIGVYSDKLPSKPFYVAIFCAIILILPLLKIINQKPKLTISKEDIVLKNGRTVSWAEIISTKIEEVNSSDVASYFRLNLLLKNDEVIKISLENLNFPVSEVSHIIEYYKPSIERKK